MRRAGLAALAVVLLAGVAAWVVPWAIEDRRPLAAVPSPRALFEIDGVVLQPGQRACSPDVGLDEHAAVARLNTVAGQRGRPPLVLELRGDGYASRTRVDPPETGEEPIDVPIDPPGGEVLVTACIVNAGEAALPLAASSERTRSRSVTSVDGRPTGKSVWLAFVEGRSRSYVERAGEIAGRLATFRPGFVTPALFWVLAVLVLLGVPAAVAAAWWHGLRAQEDAEVSPAAGARHD